MPFFIIREDITKMDTDAIVNAANSRLLAGGGVCGAIFSSAGAYELQKACDEIGFCKTGDAVITKGFKLKAKYIIHTVGPVYGENPKEEEQQLYSCYKNSLELAKEKNLDSVAFPLISSGIYGYPKAEAMKVAIKAVKDFLAENEMSVYLVIYDRKSFVVNEKLFDRVKSCIDDRLVKPDTKESMIFDTEEDAARVTADATWVTFSEMLLRLIDEKGMTDVEVYKRANIDRRLFSKIRKKDYVPKKTTVMALIVALRLDINEAEELLNCAGYAFSMARKLDVIVWYFIELGRYDIFEINETLFSFDEQLLGA